MVPGALRTRARSEHYLIMYHVSIRPGQPTNDISSAKRFHVLESCQSNASKCFTHGALWWEEKHARQLKRVRRAVAADVRAH